MCNNNVFNNVSVHGSNRTGGRKQVIGSSVLGSRFDTQTFNSIGRNSMMEDYVVLGRVGEGAHGIVMKGRHKESGQTVALKKIPLKRIEDGIGEATIREIKALQQLESVHVVRYFQCILQHYHQILS